MTGFQEHILGEIQSSRAKWALLAILAVGGILRLWTAWQPVEVLIARNLADDAYYYFVIAENIVQNGSVSMDGVHLTNGFHPLWMILLMPIFGWAPGGADLPIHLALTFAGLMDMVTILIIARLAVHFTRSEPLGLLAAWIYAANPIVILQVTNGLETALAMLTLALFLWWARHWPTQVPDARQSLGAGALAALMFLARTDSIILLGLMSALALWTWRGRPHLWRALTLASAAFLALVSPWFLWSRLVVGSWLQESGVAVPYAVRARVAMELGTGWKVALEESIRQLTYAAAWLRGDFSGMPFLVGIALWLVVAVWLLRGRRDESERKAITFLVPLVGSGLALVIAHAGIRWYPRPWYFIPTSLAFALAFVIAGRARLTSFRRVYAAFLTFSAYYALAGAIFWQIGYFPWQSEILAANRWLSANIPSDSKAASFNSGIYSYYNDFTVVNLDGVVNHQAFQAVKHRAVFPYLQHTEVDYLIDYDLAVLEEYAPFMGAGFPSGLREISALSSTPHPDLGHLRVYRVER